MWIFPQYAFSSHSGSIWPKESKARPFCMRIRSLLAGGSVSLRGVGRACASPPTPRENVRPTTDLALVDGKKKTVHPSELGYWQYRTLNPMVIALLSSPMARRRSRELVVRSLLAITFVFSRYQLVPSNIPPSLSPSTRLFCRCM